MTLLTQSENLGLAVGLASSAVVGAINSENGRLEGAVGGAINYGVSKIINMGSRYVRRRLS